jgi:small-conductance mechanosensitive channel
MFAQDLMAALAELVQRIREILPNLLAAAGLVLLGWLLGSLLRVVARRAIEASLDRMARTARIQEAVQRAGVRSTMPKVTGGFVFWVVLLFFAAAAIEILGLPVVTSSLSQFASYLPNVLAAIVIFFAGLMVGNLARAAVASAAASAGVLRGSALGRMAYVAILTMATVVALQQLGVKGEILVIIFAIVVGSVLAAGGLAFGLGARTAVSNLIGSHYVSHFYHVGQTVRIDGTEGRILDTTPTAVVLETTAGRLLIPARRFSEQSSLLVTETD